MNLPLINKESILIGRKVCNKINNMSYLERIKFGKSLLKGEKTRMVDIIGEKIIFKRLKKIARENDLFFLVIIDVDSKKVYPIGEPKKKIIYCVPDPVDGTIKVTGLGSEDEMARSGDDDVWGFSISFTKPLDKKLEDLEVKDFVYSTIIDGNPSKYYAYPLNATSFPTKGNVQTLGIFEKNIFGYKKGETIPLYTSNCKNLSRGIVCFDAFQGFDRKTAKPGTEELSIKIFSKLINRNEGGAFDIWKIYGTCADFLRNMIGYRTKKLFGPQGVARIATNDALTNYLPIYSIAKGAGGEVIDLNGEDVGNKKLFGERPNTLFVANSEIKKQILEKLKGLTR